MKMVKFIKVNLVIMNILVTLYTIAMAIATITAYSSDVPLYALCMGIGVIDIFIINISAKIMIKIYSKKATCK